MKDRNVFIDTSAFIAMRVSDDVHYNAAQGFLKAVKDQRLRLHTTNFILDEVYTYFCRTHEVAVEMAELIMNNPLISFHRVSVGDEKEAWVILKAYNDKWFSYTDATSFSIMERLTLKAVFAFDEHFKQYGKFTVLP
ncbi:MAG TPA: PIN domain-containing protein [Thermodesulfovibrionales bacterium]|nr:PIN domain-containing protein [Thermodesulfovibrionales bacterium]